MEDSKNREGKSQRDGGQERLDDRKSDATSKDSLKDIEEGEKVPDSKSERAPEDSQALSPDGTFDETRDKNDDAGPM